MHNPMMKAPEVHKVAEFRLAAIRPVFDVVAIDDRLARIASSLPLDVLQAPEAEC
jgi:hypothetical protein